MYKTLIQLILLLILIFIIFFISNKYFYNKDKIESVNITNHLNTKKSDLLNKDINNVLLLLIRVFSKIWGTNLQYKKT